MLSKEEMLARLRKKMAERSSSRRDPEQFIPPKTKPGEKIEFFMRILPPLQAGETCRINGKLSASPTDCDLWFYENASHKCGNEYIECPRIHDAETCPHCQLGFDLMEDTEDKEARSALARKYLSSSRYGVNAYFLNFEGNPENLRGKVLWFNEPKTVWEIMDACINNEKVGTPEDPQASGIFYHPFDGGYTFKLHVEKQGEYNSYEKSVFLPASVGPLVKNKDGTPKEDAIQKILDQRIYLPSKFAARDVAKLEAIVQKLLAKESGADDDTKDLVTTKPTGTKTVSAPASAPKKVVEEAVEDVVEDAVENPVEDVPEEPKKTTPVTKTTATKPTATKTTTAPKAAAPVSEDAPDPELQKMLDDLK